MLNKDFKLPNTLLNYFGGKGTLRNRLYPYFPKKYKSYVEPFGGGFSVGLRQHAEIEVYNDKDKNIYSLFKVLQDKDLFTDFKFKCDLTYFNEDIQSECSYRLTDPNLSIVDRAYCFFISNRFSINGMGKAFSLSPTLVRRGMGKRVSDFLSAVDHLEEFHQRLSRITVTNKDGIKLMKKFDKEDAFIYCDPPYVWDTRSSKYRYPCDMDNDDQQRFIDGVLQMKKAKILISGYENPIYKQLEANCFSHAIVYIHPRRSQKESVWFNYTINSDQKT